MNLDYFYSTQSEQFTFYRIPKALFFDSRFKPLSTEARLLYGLMLDRMGLSLRNNWFDEHGRVYIYFTNKDAAEMLNCGHEKAVRLFAELDGKKGVGLIERKKQGQGKPTIIYLKNFATGSTQDFRNTEVLNSENGMPRVPKERSADFAVSERNDIDISDTELNNLSRLKIDDLRVWVKHKFEYNILLQQFPYDESLITDITEILCDVFCNMSSAIRIGQDCYPALHVKRRMASMDASHIQFVLDCIKKSEQPIRNIKAYLLTTLFNAPSTIDTYYQMQVEREG